MVLSAILKLDAGAFTTGIGIATESLKSMIRVGGELSSHLTSAFDFGGNLSDIAAATGETAGTVAVLRQAFQDAGVGAERLQQSLGLMRRAIAGVNEQGQPTAKVFARLGLAVDDLASMGAEGQLKEIAAAIAQLPNATAQGAAAMEIFGRSGLDMMAFLQEPGAIDVARKSLGELPAVMDRSVAAFDTVSDRIGRVKEKGMGLWVGIAEGALPLADQITEMLDGIDLVGLGQRVAAFIGTTVELFRAAPATFGWGDALTLALGEFVNWAITGFTRLGGYILEALSAPVVYIQAAFEKVIQQVMEWIGKIPKVGKALGLEGFKAEGYADILDATREQGNVFAKLAEDALKMDPIKLIDVDDERGRFVQVWNEARAAYESNVAATREKFAVDTDSGMVGSRVQTAVAGVADKSILADAMARVGGFLGGGGGGRAEHWMERTARGVDKLNDTISRLQPAANWGV